MKNEIVNENNVSRLAKALMLKHTVDYETALRMLSQLRLHLVCADDIRRSPSTQAALLTAINCGKRAFVGGVTVSMPARVPCMLPWPGAKTLNLVAVEVGARISSVRPSQTEVLLFGPVCSPGNPADLRILSTGWRGGVMPADELLTPPTGSDFATGGVLAGALGVAKAFLRASGICTRAAHFSCGASLWNPLTNWLSAEADGPELQLLPKQLWFLGLGHLGQAALWNLGLLPFLEPRKSTFQLQDFDTVVHANLSAGLLCERQSVCGYKTRVCSEWLERRGYRTRICERPFDCTTRRHSHEPAIAVCGFDSAEARRTIDESGFDLIVECGIGSSLDNFDSILLHTFPDGSKTAADIWGAPTHLEQRAMPQLFNNAFAKNGDCGILAATLARKAISSSFVGAYAGAWMLGEILRGLHGGRRMGVLSCHLRSDEPVSGSTLSEPYSHRFAKNGFVMAAAPREESPHLQITE